MGEEGACKFTEKTKLAKIDKSFINSLILCAYFSYSNVSKAKKTFEIDDTL